MSGTRLKALYLEDCVTILCEKFEKLNNFMQFEIEEDIVKLSLFYFIEFVMMENERRQFIDTSTLNVIDD